MFPYEPASSSLNGCRRAGSSTDCGPFAANLHAEQSLAANVDVVLLVCGLDRPVKGSRIQRGVTLASDAGAEPVIVLTKAALSDATDRTRPMIVAA